MTFTVVILVVGVMAFFPDSSAGKYLRKLLVDELAEKLSALTGPRVIFLTSILLVAAGIVHFSKGQLDPLVAQVGAEVAPWFFSFDLLTFVDVVTAVLLLRLAVRFTVVVYKARLIATTIRSQGSRLVGAFYRLIASARRLRARKTRKPFGPSREDERFLTCNRTLLTA